MGLGALSCPNNSVRDISRAIRELKLRHNVPEKQELKWIGVAPSNIGLYKAVVKLFFDLDDMRFRIVAASKRNLNHAAHNQSHDDWYYKMYFTLLTRVLEQKNCYEIYLDLKDTLGSRKVQALHRMLCNAMFDFDQTAIRKIQLIRSHESAILQLADILIGGVCHLNRDATTSAAKMELIEYMRERSGFSLTKTTFLAEQKFNVFYWTGSQ